MWVFPVGHAGPGSDFRITSVILLTSQEPQLTLPELALHLTNQAAFAPAVGRIYSDVDNSTRTPGSFLPGNRYSCLSASTQSWSLLCNEIIRSPSCDFLMSQKKLMVQRSVVLPPYEALLCLPKGAKPLGPPGPSSPNRLEWSAESRKGSKRGSRESSDRYELEVL